jgi:hypothetical protein
VILFILAVVRFALEIDRDDARVPEDVAFQERILQLLAVLRPIIFTVGAAGI